MAICGNTLINLGSVLMKRGVLQQQVRDQADKAAVDAAHDATTGGVLVVDVVPSPLVAAPACCCCWRRGGAAGSPWWPLGSLLFVIGNALNFASLSMADLSLLAALGSVQFVANVLFSRLLLGESASLTALAGTAAIVVGNCVVTHFAPQTSQDYGVEDLMALGQAGPYLFYLFCLATLTCIAQGIYSWRVRVGRGRDRIASVSFALVSALFGTQSNLQGKCLSILVVALFGEEARDVVLEAPTFLFSVAILWLAATAWWLHRMHLAFALFPAVIIPILQICWMMLSICNGVVYFGEGANNPKGQMIAFTGGLGVVIAGVILLASSRPQTVGGEDGADAAAVQVVEMVTRCALDSRSGACEITGREDIECQKVAASEISDDVTTVAPSSGASSPRNDDGRGWTLYATPRHAA